MLKIDITETKLVWPGKYNVVFQSRSVTNKRTGYTTQKPIALLKKLTAGLAPEGGRVGDFFVGSGTMFKACELKGRRWTGCNLGRWGIHVKLSGEILGNFFKLLREIPEADLFHSSRTGIPSWSNLGTFATGCYGGSA